ncbi:class I SAM-dependent methyltransferase [Salinarchaeum sp. Harcht-Bsk1]|uniref:class I SAM-dependent methyltransferase n=1 Tax=Salinarchaeum sp. Harcht-Bsk1 TaxID=1333523 RepID=UPI00191C69ED|nr:class I SAM-dependent methyltransferase [Salinarchaeum sp. Harcht-Bsk1]
MLLRGLRNPQQIPPFVVGTVFPESRWGPNWRKKDGFITFDDGGFAGGDPSRPELSARLYRESRHLDSVLGNRSYDRALELGCGYGRLTGWISEHAEETIGVDPNGDAIERARTLYPELEFEETLGQDLPFEDDSFDLIVSWNVLQHIPPDAVGEVASELRRVLAEGGTINCCEMTSGDGGRASWVRSRAEYESLFAPLTLVDVDERPAERTFEYANRGEAMVFERDGGAPRGIATSNRTRPVREHGPATLQKSSAESP